MRRRELLGPFWLEEGVFMFTLVKRRSVSARRGSRLLVIGVSVAWLSACAGDDSSPGGASGAAATGGATSAGATFESGGTQAARGGASAMGGATAGTSMAAGGVPAAGTAGSSPTGGAPTGGVATAGRATTGGAGSGGADSGGRGGAATGGGANIGGATASGGGGAGSAGSPGGSSSMAGTSSGGAAQTDGCGKAPTLKNSTSNSNPTPITLSVAGVSREYVIRWPSNYDNTRPYRLILDLHGFGGTYRETAGEDYFGLWSVSDDTTVFIALSAIDTDWRTGDNLAYVDAVLKAVEADLCIDPTRVMLEGFSQGAAEAWQLACSRPGVFRAVVGHSGGGVTNPTSCEPIPYLGSGGLQENVTQTTQTDQFAKWNGCTVTTLPKASSGTHVCTNYTGCPLTAPVRWCNYDGPHTPLPTDSGMSSSWMPSETWPFFSQF